jgi:hypothetical protein
VGKAVEKWWAMAEPNQIIYSSNIALAAAISSSDGIFTIIR